MKEIIQTNNIAKRKPKVLVAPLDWGLGHTTRCIPVIKELLNAGCEVVIASEKGQKALLELEFPALQSVELRGYRLKYGKNRLRTFISIFLQIPKILTQIKRENRWLAALTRVEHLDAVISDNRYGLYTPGLFSVFITHQLCIQSPFGSFVEKKLQGIHYRFINRFDACWIPDVDKEHPLAGKLAHPEKFPEIPVRYIGWLSRFTRTTGYSVAKDLLIMLSGPEPQRTLFEKILLRELEEFNGTVVLVRGLPAEKNTISAGANVEVYNHLSTVALQKKIAASEWVIGRSGYSTVMDIVKMGKKSILIATPGQTEQEYLASYLFNHHIAFTATQDDFSLKAALEGAKKFEYTRYESNTVLLQAAIAALINTIN